MNTENVVEMSAHGLTTAKIQQLSTACQSRSLQFLQRTAAALFDQIDDELYKQAEKSLNDTLQTSYFVAMRELRVLRKEIVSGFVDLNRNALDEYFSSAGAGLSAGRDNKRDDLALLDEDELEENLAVTNIISKAENRFRVDIDSLGKRFALLAGHDTAHAGVNPLGPVQITESFHSALDQWQGNLLVKLVVYKLFDKYVIAETGEFYRELNDYLISEDVLPRLASSAAAKKSRKDDRVGSSRVNSGDAAATASEPSLAGLSAQIQALVGKQRESLGLPVLPVVVGINLPQVDIDEIVDVLAELQQSFVFGSPFNLQAAQFTNTEFKKSLMKCLGVSEDAETQKKLGKSEQHIIDMVMMLFDFVLDDPMMADPMKVLLGRLQIPVLRAAIADREFLNDRHHPARSLLNNLARVAIRWEDDDDRSERSLYSRIEDAVARILEEFDGRDVSLFADVDKQFMAYVSKEVRGARIAEQRLAQIARGQEQLVASRERVTRELETRMGYDLPTTAFRILDEGWRDVLTLILLREGDSSANWQSSLKVVDDLVESVSFQETALQRQKVMRTIPPLLKSLRAGFESISFDQAKTAKMLKELQICHINALRKGRVKSAQADDKPVIEEAHGEPAVESSDRFTRWAADLAADQWITWELDDGSKIRAKLVWRSEVTDMMLFVNRKGRKVLELSQQSLADAARAGRASAVKDISVPIVERALKAIGGMIANVRSNTLAPA